MTTTTDVTCSGCGADASERTSEEPCPNCGATSRTHSGSATLAITATLTATASVGYSATPTWERQWLDLRSAHDTVAAYYTGMPMNNQDAARAVHAGCLAASSLAEYLPDVAAGKANRNTFPALRDAADLSNTWKHGARKPGLTKGRVAHDHGHVDGTSDIELEFIAPGQPPRSRDALELLRSCLDSWAGYLTSEGFTVEWPPATP